MNAVKEKKAMSIEELDELLELKGWSRTQLAANLDLHGTSVERWYMTGNVPGGPTSILLRIWLDEARAAQPRKAAAAR